jgi:hypothetical protein
VTGVNWLYCCLSIVVALLFVGLLTSPGWLNEWAGNIVRNHEFNNMDKLTTGKIERTLDCYGYSVTKLSSVDMDKITGVFLNYAGQHIDIKYLRTDVEYTLYKVRSWGNFYYVECEGAE